ncbi:uncharacterized protein [Rutidosis leptorrhynchoides]|uniref:uncharacterized protein n=1 Tax=Rutidosis leptorrhynchoides TaxID=125765 RepID=UPI003A9A0D09
MGSRPTHWCKVVPPNINFFLWRTRLNRLPDKCNLLDKGIVVPNLLCSSCSSHIEDLPHVFFDCEITVSVWSYIASWIDMTLPVWNSVEELWQWIMSSSQQPVKVIILEAICYATIWTLWRFRNGRIFDPSKFKKCFILDTIVLSSFDWISSRYKKANLNWIVWLQNPLSSL